MLAIFATPRSQVAEENPLPFDIYNRPIKTLTIRLVLIESEKGSDDEDVDV